MGNPDTFLSVLQVVTIFSAPIGALAYFEVAGRTDLPCPEALLPGSALKVLITITMAIGLAGAAAIVHFARPQKPVDAMAIEAMRWVIAISVALAAAFAAEAAMRRGRIKSEVKVLLAANPDALRFFEADDVLEVERGEGGTRLLSLDFGEKLNGAITDIHERHAHRMALPVKIWIGAMRTAP